MKGDAALLGCDRRVAVVGSRRGSERGRRCAERLGMDLGRAGVAVVSGLALGIDGEAHRGALAVAGPCIGVVATGLDAYHPSSHRRLHEDVARQGLLVSEYPPGTSTQKYAFVARNRILAALGQALVVVEAGARSGALGTVDFALQMGHSVMCYPGPVDCVASQGSLRLLREGAELVRHGQDVLESLGVDAPKRSPASVLGLGARPESAEDIARRLERSLAEVLSELVELEGDGHVRRVPGGRWSVTS
jgi:DNA processing protein